MPLSHGTVNPLSVLGFRKLPFIPNHFKKFTISNLVKIDEIDEWINYNLTSRYAIKKTYSVDQKAMVEVIELGFEDPMEVTLLLLKCPLLT